MQFHYITCKPSCSPNGSPTTSKTSRDVSSGQALRIHSQGGHCLLAWPKVTLPKINGGLNIMDIEFQNKTLLLKWLWTADSDSQCLWTHTLNSIGITMDVLKQTNTAPDISHTSFFLRDLTTLLPMYDITVNYSSNGTPHSRWSTSFAVQPIYKLYNNPGIAQKKFQKVWALKAPNKIKTFLWLLLHDKLNTANNLERKGWPSNHTCVMCTTSSLETGLHLFHSCPYASNLLSRMIPGNTQGQPTMKDAWSAACLTSRQRLWDSTVWEIWKERNRHIFRGERHPMHRTLDLIHDNIHEWSLAYDK
jgi:zinc-binding in reverse transcriptase